MTVVPPSRAGLAQGLQLYASFHRRHRALDAALVASTASEQAARSTEAAEFREAMDSAEAALLALASALRDYAGHAAPVRRPITLRTVDDVVELALNLALPASDLPHILRLAVDVADGAVTARVVGGRLTTLQVIE